MKFSNSVSIHRNAPSSEKFVGSDSCPIEP